MTLIPDHIPRAKLILLPTAIISLKRLSKLVGGPQLWMKRDDLTGLGMGGNKTRKLEFLMGDAIAKGSDTVITAGSVQSNHCRQTAAAAAVLGMNCHLLLGGYLQPYEGNLLLDHLFGAHIHWAGDARKGEGLSQLMDQLRRDGNKPYLIPYGGSNEVGALGFVHAINELKDQEAELGIHFDAIVFASSSGGTHAGLMVASQLLNSETEVIGIGIDKSPPGEPTIPEKIKEIADGTMTFLGHEPGKWKIQLIKDYMNRPYAECGELELNAITNVARTEGILLDPVYTGRAMGGLLDLINKRKFKEKRNILFWHTGGAPALFAYTDELC